MNRDFYFYGNLFLGLGVASGLLQGILYLLVGSPILWLDSFTEWYLVMAIITLAGSLFLLKYYHHRKYWFTLTSGIVVTLANLFLFVILYIMLVSRQLENYYYIPLLVFALGAGLVYGISLIFSSAGKSPWLKAAGVIICIIGVIFGSGLLWGMMDRQVQVDGTLETIDQWTSLARSLIPVLFMIQFLSDVKLLKLENENPTMQKSSENLFGIMGIIAFGCTIVFGVMIAREGFSSLYWKNRNAELTRELVEKSETRTFVSSKGDSLRFLLLKPLNYDPQKKYPLVVCLPYGGYEDSAAKLLSNDINRKKYPAFLFVPYRIVGTSWGGVPEKANMVPRDSLVYETLLALEDPGIDEKRIYVSGVSLGGYGSWHFISTHPEMFAAAIPVCGEGDPEFAPKIVDVPVWAFHGAKDRNVPVSGSRDMIEAIKKAGGNPRYTEFPDKAHNIWHQVSETPGLLDWLFEQRRD